MTRRTPGKFTVSVARVTKLAGFSVLAASLMAMSATGSLAQSAADSAKPSERKDTMYQQIKRGADVAIFLPLAAVTVPTTKILAIGNVTAKERPTRSAPCCLRGTRDGPSASGRQNRPMVLPERVVRRRLHHELHHCCRSA